MSEACGVVGLGAAFQQFKQFRISENSVFDDFRHSGSEFTNRQAGQGGWVDQHKAGLMERPDQILAARVIHTGLAADGCIDHRQKRGRNLDNTNAPKPGCRCKTGHVSHNTTA